MKTEQLPVVAYLGPEGTYTHQAVMERFADVKIALEPRPTISETFNAALAKKPCIAFVPWENSKYGQVVDTYDALRAGGMGVSAQVGGEHTISIEHCLVVREGTRLVDVRRILGHEQALGQCKEFLTRELPDATLVRVVSTAAAAQMIAESTSSNPSEDAAICARICVDLYHGLEVLKKGIQDEPDNHTRFMMVVPRDGPPPPPPLQCKGRRRALIRVSGVDGDVIRRIASCIRLQARLIDRRPSLEGRGQDYFIEVEAEGGRKEAEWSESVMTEAEGIKGTVLGLWNT